MKTAAFLLSMLLAAGTAAAQEESSADGKESQPSLDEVRTDLQKSFDELFTLMGAVVGGLKTGLEEGAKNIQTQLDGSDGTTLIATAGDLRKHTQCRIYGMQQKADGGWKISLAVANPNAYPVRLANLTKDGAVLLIDDEGFAHSAIADTNSPRTLTVPENSAKKIVFSFPETDGAKPSRLRLYGAEFQLEKQNVL